jgi:mitosis inhibitor protein kinase SWE1
MFEYSPRHHSTGSAAHLLSPTHHSTIESIKQLRRTLSRSPSKPARFQLYTARANTSPSGQNAPSSPSALSRAYSADATAAAEPAPKARFSVKRSGTRPSFRRTSPNSPLRRALSDKANQSNVRPSLIRRTSAEDDQENMDCSSDAPRRTEQRFDEPIKLDFNKPRADALLQPVLKEHLPPKSSPLKRSDGVMNLEAANIRSLHGAMTFGNDFNVFDQNFDGASGDSNEKSEDKEKEETGSNFSTWPTPSAQSPHRRPFGLRKSTLQQRVGGPGRTRLFTDAPHDPTPGSALTRARSRFSLDGALPLRTADIDSPFRRNNVNEPPVLFAQPSQKFYQSAPKPHPLSIALTPSSSNSSITNEESQKTQLAVAPVFTKPELPRPANIFAKSLPVGALRPTKNAAFVEQTSSQDFATPTAFKMARPMPQAFMSTGLISKRNRSIDMPGASFGAGPMPDTPSKKTHIVFSGTPAPARVR